MSGSKQHAGCGHDHGPGHHHHRVPPPTRTANTLFSARGIDVRLGGRAILEQVDIDIQAGEIVTVIGPNGAGKTTLVRVLLGLMTPNSGELWRRPGLRIGYAPQRFDRDRALPLSVARFLELGSSGTAKPLAPVLEEVGAGHIIKRQLHDLSGGELQRVVLARALLRSPELLVLDEPARGVDYVGEAELYDLIGRLRTTRGVGVLLVSHDLHVVMARSDRVICLNTHVCCAGKPERVALDPEYRRLFGATAAEALAFYRHTHDHAHDLTGETRRLPDPSNPAPPAPMIPALPDQSRG